MKTGPTKPEALLVAQIKGANLPLPKYGKEQVRLYPRKLLPGRQKLVPFRFDLAWDGPKLAVEVMGGTWVNGAHNRGATYERDCEKLAEAQIQGWVVLKVTTDMVESGRALDLIRDALGV
jgi:hypothetical protein